MIRDQILQELDTLKSNFHHLLSITSKITNETINTPMQAGKWSIAQTIYHLGEIFIATNNYINKKMQYQHSLKPSGFRSALRSFILNKALQSKLKFKAPSVLAQNIPVAISFTEAQQFLLENMQLFEKTILSIPEEHLTKELFKHPVVGRLNTMQTIRFLERHLYHHEKQITEYLKKANLV